MRTKKFILFSIILVFLISSVSAVSIYLNVDVKNSQSPKSPISGAQVKVFRQNGGIWDGTTNSAGRAIITIPSLPPDNTYEFYINVTAANFQKKVKVPYSVYVKTGEPHEYTVPTIYLDIPDICDGDEICEPAQGENTSNCLDCPPPAPTSGIVKDIQFIQLVSSARCPSGYTEKESFYGTGFYSTILSKLCVKFESQITNGSLYVKTAYLYPNTEEHECEEGANSVYSFLGGTPFNFCVGTANINNPTTDQYVWDIKISDTGDCGSTKFNKKSGPFQDSNGVSRVMCTAINGLASTSSCNLTEPKWVNTKLETQSEVTGWLGTSTDSSDYDYIRGISDLSLYVKAAGCQQDIVKFEIWEGQSNPTLKYTFSQNEQQPIDGYKYFVWKPEWFEKTGPGINSEGPIYYTFKAIVEGSNPQVASPFSPTLTVIKPGPAQCHFNEDSDADDKECRDNPDIGPGYFCTKDNTCKKLLVCSKNADCDNSLCDPVTKNCVECYNSTQCAEFGEDYICDINAQSNTYKTCVFSRSCQVSSLGWQSASDNPLGQDSVIKGWVGNKDWMCGDSVKLVAVTEGCENAGNLVFVLTEQNSLLLRDRMTYTPKIVTGDQKLLKLEDFRPPWGMDFSSFLGGGNFQYKFYLATEDDPSTPLKNAQDSDLYSTTLFVEKPLAAQCDPTSDRGRIKCARLGTGKLCDEECNKCVDPCSKDTDCKDDKFCANQTTGGTPGQCYECFYETDCNLNEDKKFCAPAGSPTPFTCIQCINNSQCDASKGEICKNNECTTSCDTNADCAVNAKSLTEDQKLAMSPEARAEAKDKTICNTDSHTCVACNANLKNEEVSFGCTRIPSESTCSIQGGCCWTGTACLIEENKCVECLEDSICGPGSHCNTQDNKCESGYGTAFPGGNLFSGLGSLSQFIPGLG